MGYTCFIFTRKQKTNVNDIINASVLLHYIKSENQSKGNLTFFQLMQDLSCCYFIIPVACHAPPCGLPCSSLQLVMLLPAACRAPPCGLSCSSLRPVVLLPVACHAPPCGLSCSFLWPVVLLPVACHAPPCGLSCSSLCHEDSESDTVSPKVQTKVWKYWTMLFFFKCVQERPQNYFLSFLRLPLYFSMCTMYPTSWVNIFAEFANGMNSRQNRGSRGKLQLNALL